MAQQDYNIQKIVFSVEAAAKEKAHELQNRISRIVNDSLLYCADTFLDENISSDFVFKMDSLAIDIGDIEEDRLEQDIVPRFAELFCNEISAAMLLLRRNQQHLDNGIYIEQTFQSKFNLLEHFLLTGTLLWWAEKQTVFFWMN